MAAGKTSVAAALARRLACEAFDLDEAITAEEGRTPHQIIVADGEFAFRDFETKCLERALESNPHQVIALGGGAWIMERNRDLIERYGGMTVWLDAPFDLCWQRIGRDECGRPLAPSIDIAQRLYELRRETYGIAKIHLQVSSNSSVDALAAELASLLNDH
jgi:shikimate kinase